MLEKDVLSWPRANIIEWNAERVAMVSIEQLEVRTIWKTFQ